MAEVQYEKPFHVYADDVSPQHFHSGHENIEMAEAAAKKANAEAEKLGIKARYTAVAKP